MSVNITERQLPHQYEKYVVDMDRFRRESKHADGDNTTAIQNDTVDISKAARNALKNKMSVLSRRDRIKLFKNFPLSVLFVLWMILKRRY